MADEWDTRPWEVGTLCKAFYNFGDGFLYRVVAITRVEQGKCTILTLDPVISVFAANAGKKHTKQRELGSTLCTPMSLNDIREELNRLENFLKDEERTPALNATAARESTTTNAPVPEKAAKKKKVPAKGVNKKKAPAKAAKTASKRK